MQKQKKTIDQIGMEIELKATKKVFITKHTFTNIYYNILKELRIQKKAIDENKVKIETKADITVIQ